MLTEQLAANREQLELLGRIPAIIVTAVTGCQSGSPRGSSCRCTMPAILAAQ
jgi:hypothetical protein